MPAGFRLELSFTRVLQLENVLGKHLLETSCMFPVVAILARADMFQVFRRVQMANGGN